MTGERVGWQTVALYVLFALVVAGILSTAIASGAIALACGAARPQSMFAGLQLAIGGSSGGFRTAAGCHVPVLPIRLLDVLALAAAVAAAVALLTWWLRYVRSDLHFSRELRVREGLATRGDVRRYGSARAAANRARSERRDAAAPLPTTTGWRVGRAHGQDVVLPVSDPLVVEAAAHSRAADRFIADAIADWDGPVIATSTRGDAALATRRARQQRGEVTVFDPQGLSGARSVRISPAAGCEDPMAAERRAHAIVTGAGRATSAADRDAARATAATLSRLLQAAAVSGRGADALARWGADPRLAREAVAVLAEQGTPGWADDLDAIVGGDEHVRAASWRGVAAALRPLEIPSISAAMSPGPGEQFDARAFLSGANTLHLVGTGTGAGASGGFLAAVLDDVADAARHGAGRAPAFMLDDVASMFSWPGLEPTMADGDIPTAVVLRSPARGETVWSAAEIEAVRSAAPAALLFGGASDAARLRDLAALLGTRRARGGAQGERVPVVTADELRRMPETTALMVYRDRRGILLDLPGPAQHRVSAPKPASTAAEPAQNLVFAEQYTSTAEPPDAAGERG